MEGEYTATNYHCFETKSKGTSKITHLHAPHILVFVQRAATDDNIDGRFFSPRLAHLDKGVSGWRSLEVEKEGGGRVKEGEISCVIFL